MSRVGAVEVCEFHLSTEVKLDIEYLICVFFQKDPSLEGADLTTTIGRATGSAGFDEKGNPIYRNRNTESAAEKAKRRANREIKEMAERLSADQSIIVN